jgi:hypothetical protein
LHVHNVYRQPVLNATSGLRLWITPKLRRHDAGVGGTGFAVWGLSIPPNQTDVAFEGVCPIDCLADIAPRGIKVFATLYVCHRL